MRVWFTRIQPSSTAFRLFLMTESRDVEEMFKELFPSAWKMNDSMFSVGYDTVTMKDVVNLLKVLYMARARDDTRIWLPETPFVTTFIDSVAGGVRLSNTYPMSGENYVPMMMIIDVGPYCHLNCPWCYAGTKKEVPQLPQYLLNYDVEEMKKILVSYVEKAVREANRRAVVSGLPEPLRIYVTLSIGGSGDPLSLQALDLHELIADTKEVCREIMNIDGVQYCFTALSTGDVIKLPTVARYLRGLNEVSISIHYGRERRCIGRYKDIDDVEYGKMVAEAIEETLKVVDCVSLQIMVREASTIEMNDLENVLYTTFMNLRARDASRTTIFLLRYYEVPWFSEFRPPTLDTVMRFVETIASVYPFDIADEVSPIQFDSCLATMLFGIPVKWIKDTLGLMHRLRLFHGKREPEEVKGCPRGRDCQIKQYVMEENSTYGE